MNNPTFYDSNIKPLEDESPELSKRRAIECRLENMSVAYLYTQEGIFLRKVAFSLQNASILRKLNEKLSSTNDELTRFQEVTMNREMKMVELKKENDALRAELRKFKG